MCLLCFVIRYSVLLILLALGIVDIVSGRMDDDCMILEITNLKSFLRCILENCAGRISSEVVLLLLLCFIDNVWMFRRDYELGYIKEGAWERYVELMCCMENDWMLLIRRCLCDGQQRVRMRSMLNVGYGLGRR